MSSLPPPGPSPLDAATEFCNQRGYELLERRGSGNFKVVYHAVVEGVPVALKVASVYGSTERFKRETDAFLSCSHPNIAAVREGLLFELGAHQFWVVIEELLVGGTLEERLQAAPLSAAEARNIGGQLGDALAHLHDRRLVHRDVKPANILFREDPNIPVLTDFGIVRVLDAPTLTQPFAAQGPNTPAFAAPEQLNNEMSLIDGRTDQFGLAVTLHMAMFGTHPYMAVGEDIRHAIARVSEKAAMPPENVARLAELGFDSLWRALQPWPAQRFRKSVDFATAIRSN